MHIRLLEDLVIWEEPELCLFMNCQFASEFNYAQLFSMFTILLEHEHTAVPFPAISYPQILEKTLVLIYKNIDFFCGEARFQVFPPSRPHR